MDTAKINRVKKRYVVKSNQLITRVCMLSPQSQKLFCIFVALMNSDRAQNQVFWLTIRELSALLNLEKYKDYRQEIIKMIDELEGGTMILLDVNTATHFISSVRFNPETGIVYFEFPEPLLDHIGKVRGNYTKYQLNTILPLKGFYSLKFYELMKKDAYKKRITYDLTQFRSLLSVPDDKYLKFDHFKQKVLLKSIYEINLKTDLTVTYKTIKQSGSKTIIGIEFEIVANDKDIKDFQERIKQELKVTGLKRFDEPLIIPDKHLNSAVFNTCYENFIEYQHNFPSYYTFDNFIQDNGMKITKSKLGGKDITFQFKIPYDQKQ